MVHGKEAFSSAGRISKDDRMQDLHDRVCTFVEIEDFTRIRSGDDEVFPWPSSRRVIGCDFSECVLSGRIKAA